MLLGRSDGLDDIPVLYDLTAFDTEEVIEGHGLACEAPFADSEDEVPLTEDAVYAVIDHCDALLSHSFECCTETREPVSDSGVVLDVVVTVEVARELLGGVALQDVRDELSDELLIGFGLVEVLDLGRTVDYRVTAGVSRGRLFLQIVPVLYDLLILEAEDVEADLGAEEVVVRVGDDEVTILQDAYRI